MSVLGVGDDEDASLGRHATRWAGPVRMSGLLRTAHHVKFWYFQFS